MNKYSEDIHSIKDMEWIQKVYKESVQGLVGYFIQFLDGSFIVGRIKENSYEYGYIKKNSYISSRESNESQAELFVNFINVKFDGELATDSFFKALHEEFDSEREKSIDDMSKSELNLEMIQAAKEENFERASLLKKKLEEK
jgi:hypothetical protein